MSKKPFYITTAIVYPNSRMHLGFAWEVVSTDIIARFKRMKGYDVFFSTGMDEHSKNVEKKAISLNLTSKEYCDQMAVDIKNVFEQLDISYNRFIRTSDDDHMEVAAQLIQKAFEKGDIYKNSYGGFYCDSCETFYTEKELLDGEGCPVHKTKTHWEEEENYFFALTKYQDALLKLHEENPQFLQPESRRQEMLQFIRTGLRDFSVSRSNFSWGVPIPFEKGHVIYVWYDALINYLTSIGFLDNKESFEKYWSNTTHVIGKDISRFHTIYWPAMLMSLDIDLPKHVFAHGFLNLQGEKMSSSRGNFITPDEVMDKYGSEPLRYYLTADNNFKTEGNFLIENLEQRLNADLANDLGNLISRALSMQKKYFDGKVIKRVSKTESDNEILDLRDEVFRVSEGFIDSFELHEYIKNIWRVISAANKYIVINEPWRLASDGNIERLEEVMYLLLDTIAFITVMIKPVLPKTSKRVSELLNISDDVEFSFIESRFFYSSDSIVDGDYKIFQKVEVEKKKEAEKPQKKLKNIKSEITIDDFGKLDLRVGKILSVEAIEGSDKLYKLMVDVGEIRQIVSGIAKFYPESQQLVGKLVSVIVNLKPVELLGVRSEGMILAASTKNSLTLLSPESQIGEGSKIS